MHRTLLLAGALVVGGAVCAPQLAQAQYDRPTPGQIIRHEVRRAEFRSDRARWEHEHRWHRHDHGRY